MKATIFALLLVASLGGASLREISSSQTEPTEGPRSLPHHREQARILQLGMESFLVTSSLPVLQSLRGGISFRKPSR